MPKAMVATITMPSSRWKRSWCRRRASASMPAWYGRAAMPWRFESRRGLVHLLARQAIDDARLAGVLGADEIEQLAARIVLLDDAVADVRPVEARHERARVAELQALDDLGARLRIGGGGERDARHAGEALVAAPRAAGTPGGSRGPIATRSAPRRWRTARARVCASRSRQRGVSRRSGATYSRSSSPRRARRSTSRRLGAGQASS